MALTLQSEVDLANQALDRIAAAPFTLAAQTTVTAVAVNRHYYQVRNMLLRSYDWPFATARTELVQIQTLTLDDAPTTDAFVAGDTLTGGTSGTTCTVLEVLSDTEYVIAYLDGDFTDGEEISNGADTRDCDPGYPTVAATTPLFKWTYQYALPTDYHRLISVYEDDGTDDRDERWTIEGKRILTNYNTLNIQYIRAMTNPDDYDAMFTEMFILALALRLIPPLVGTKSSQLTAEIKDELRRVEIRARAISKNENVSTGRSDVNQSRYS